MSRKYKCGPVYFTGSEILKIQSGLGTATTASTSRRNFASIEGIMFGQKYTKKRNTYLLGGRDHCWYCSPFSAVKVEENLAWIHHSLLKAVTGLELEPGNPPAAKGTSSPGKTKLPIARNLHRAGGLAVTSLTLSKKFDNRKVESIVLLMNCTGTELYPH